MAAASGISDTLLPRAVAAVRVLRRGAARIEAVRPAPILAGLTLAQLAVAAWIAHAAAHNGRLYGGVAPASGDWTAAWALGHLWVPASGSFGPAVLLWPLALAAGGSLPAALPALVVVQAAVGLPLVLLATYAIAARLAGRLFGYAAALGWTLAPLAALAYFYSGQSQFEGIVYTDYRADVRDLVVPHELGLAAGAPFLSLLAITGSAWLLVRGLDTGGWDDVLLGGLLAGLALGIDPGNVVFLPAPVLALAVARRPRQLAGFLVALLPAVVTLALWRWTAAGHLTGLGHPTWSRETFRLDLINLKAVGFSALLIEWIAVAGSFAVIRKSPAKGVLVAVWFLGFFLTVPGRADVRHTDVFRLLVPGFPAFVLLTVGLVLLVPGLGRRRRERPVVAPSRPVFSRKLAAGAVVLGLYPLTIVAIASAAPRDRVVHAPLGETGPVTGALGLRAESRNGHTVLSWRRPSAGGTKLSYAVYRDPVCRRRREGAQDCVLVAGPVAVVPVSSWSDPQAGRSSYRVAAVADARSGTGGDIVVVSPEARAP